MVEHLLEDGARTTLIVGVLIMFTVFVAWGSRVLRLPAPLTFLAIGVAVASTTDFQLDPSDADWLVTIGTVALAIILFEGGFHGGWSRTRAVIKPVLAIGLVGTLVTAGAMTLLGHYLLGLSWQTAGFIGVALAPTDPATVFSVLSGRTLKGRAGEVLEGESGMNDPVGIALMIGLLEIAMHGSGGGAVLDVATAFGTELLIGVLGGVVVGLVGNWVLTHMPLPSQAVHSTAAIAVALLALGITVQFHGSGFLAAFVAGLVIGERDVRHHDQTESTLSVVANLGETAMFLLLGLTITVASFDDWIWTELVTFVLLTFLVRPIVTGALLAPSSPSRAEIAFVTWGGLRGAVPILLAFFVLIESVEDADLIYTVVFVAVSLSVLVQGMTLPLVGQRLGVIEEADSSR